MGSIAGFEFFPLEITKEGKVHDEGQAAAILAAVTLEGPGRVDALLVLAHGWNNDMADARRLYERLLGSMRALLDRDSRERDMVIAGVFWPSKKFADEELIPAGGVASVGTAAAGAGSMPDEALKRELERLKGTFDRPDEAALDKAKGLVERLEDSPSAQREFADLLRSLLPRPADITEDASDSFFKRPGDELLGSLRAPVRLTGRTRGGAAGMAGPGQQPAGGAAGFGDLFTGFKAAAWKLLNYTTYYQMKERAGVVGGGLNAVLARVRSVRPDLRLHLVGHSFGARAVTAATDGAAALRPASLVLLQGAFSHHGFAEKFDERTDGFFRRVVAERKVDGPMVVTHTANDRAVGIAYAIASRISGDNRAAFGDAEDMYGGIGRNGAVRMKPEEMVNTTLLGDSGQYAFKTGRIHNLLSDVFVGSHSDVSNKAVANVILAAARC
jgi:hypothetical protein